jgi:two-component system response regulator HupR/HoxA
LNSSEPPSAAKPIQRISLLVVDDDRALLETTLALLEDGFDARGAVSGLEALRLLEKQPSHVVCADFDMPGLNGVELLHRVCELYPGTTGILVTGLRDQLPAGVARDESIFAVIYKPYAPDALIRTIQNAVSLAAMTRAVTSFGRSSKRLKKRG